MSSPASRPGPRPRFTLDDVTAVALELIDSGRAEAFTMRAVADRLGVGVMTLYGYVANKEELLEAVTMRAFADAREPFLASGWEDTLRAEVRGLHDVSRRHPTLVTLVLAQRSALPGLFRMRERMLEALLSGGLSDASAVQALGVLCNYALGFAAAQAGGAPIELPERIRELPPEEFPRLTSLASTYAEHLSDDAFEAGLDWLIRGLRA